MKASWIRVFVLVAIVCLIKPCFGAETIKIGVIDAFSGMAVVNTDDRFKGAKLALDEVNESGGVLGRKVEFIIRDDMLSPDTAVKHMEELVHREKVNFILGPSSSSVLLAMVRWAKDNKFPFLAWDARTDKATTEYGHRYAFRSISNTYMDAAAMAQFFSKKPWSKYATISPDYEYGHSLVNHYKAQMEKLKPESKFVTEQWPKVGEIDYSPYITPILATKPDVLYCGLWGGDAMALIKQAKAFGILEKMNLVVLHLGEQILQPMGGSMPEGIWTGTNYNFEINTPENKIFVSKFRNAYGRLPGDFSFAGYVGVKFVSEGIKKAKSLDKEKIVDALEDLTIKTPGRPITLRKFDHQGNMGLFIGRTKKSPEYPLHLVLEILDDIPGDKIMMPTSMVKELREKAK